MLRITNLFPRSSAGSWPAANHWSVIHPALNYWQLGLPLSDRNLWKDHLSSIVFLQILFFHKYVTSYSWQVKVRVAEDQTVEVSLVSRCGVSFASFAKLGLWSKGQVRQWPKYLARWTFLNFIFHFLVGCFLCSFSWGRDPCANSAQHCPSVQLPWLDPAQTWTLTSIGS